MKNNHHNYRHMKTYSQGKANPKHRQRCKDIRLRIPENASEQRHESYRPVCIFFFSAFLVSSRVTVILGRRWGNTLRRGTSILLHLKDNAYNYLDIDKMLTDFERKREMFNKIGRMDKTSGDSKDNGDETHADIHPSAQEDCYVHINALLKYMKLKLRSCSTSKHLLLFQVS